MFNVQQEKKWWRWRCLWARNVEIQCSAALNGLGLHWHNQIKQTSLKDCLFTQEREGKLEDVESSWP